MNGDVHCIRARLFTFGWFLRNSLTLSIDDVVSSAVSGSRQWTFTLSFGEKSVTTSNSLNLHSNYYLHLSASSAIKWWSVETQIVLKHFLHSWIAVKDNPRSEISSILWMFFNLIPLEPPRARIKAVTAEERFAIRSIQLSDVELHEITKITKTNNFSKWNILWV